MPRRKQWTGRLTVGSRPLGYTAHWLLARKRHATGRGALSRLLVLGRSQRLCVGSELRPANRGRLNRRRRLSPPTANIYHSTRPRVCRLPPGVMYAAGDTILVSAEFGGQIFEAFRQRSNPKV
jgi:hypothetical protein